MTVEPLPPQGGVRVVRASGELDVLTARPVQDRVTVLAEDAPLVLDLTEVTFLDSSGVAALNRLARWHEVRGGFRVVAPPGGRPRRVLDVVGFPDVLVVDDAQQGLDQLRG